MFKNYLTAVNNVLFTLTSGLKNCHHLEYYFQSVLKHLFEIMQSTALFCSRYIHFIWKNAKHHLLCSASSLLYVREEMSLVYTWVDLSTRWPGLTIKSTCWMSDQARVFLNIRGRGKKRPPLLPLRSLHNPSLKAGMVFG